MAMDDEFVKKNEKSLTAGFLNTYTFTKNLAERYIRKNQHSIPCVIFRPSIIACAVSEPFPGWTDTLSAAGGLSFLGSIGLVQLAHQSGQNRIDITPVDYVSNGLIIATVKGSKSKNGLQIYNYSSSVRNPITTGEYHSNFMDDLQFFAIHCAVRKPKVVLEPSYYKYQLKKWV